jgi:6-phosphogluconolactonase
MGTKTSRRSGRWTRREFMQGAASMAALQHLPLQAAPLQGFAYVASGRDAIAVFSLRSDRWTLVQSIPSGAPACVLLHPSRLTLYVANEVDVYEGLPRGTVEVFQIGALDGKLTLLGRRPLSLSATHPRHMALSPDGKVLAVAAFGGGVYNLLPVGTDGSLGPPSGIFKDAGCGSHPQLQTSAHPHTLCFDTTGRHLLASDFGSDRISAFAVEDGGLRRNMHRSTGEGSGPAGCALHPAGSVIYSWHELEGSLAGYRYDDVSGRVGEAVQRISLDASPGAGALAMHPSGRALYTADGSQRGLRVWSTTALSCVQRVSLGEAIPNRICVSVDGRHAFVLDDVQGSIYRMSVEPTTGGLYGGTKVAVVDEPKGVAFSLTPGLTLRSG